MNTPKPSNRSSSSKTINRGHITVSYEEGLSEGVKNICKRYGIEVHLRSGKSIKDELVAPKDQDHLTKKVAFFTDTNVIGWSVMRSI